MNIRRLLGQYFLRDQKILKKIIQTADLSEKDTVLEIGPGHGELTFELAKKAGLVLAAEKDKRLAKQLKAKAAKFKNIKIIEGDILKLTNRLTNQLKNYKIVANIPYYLTSRLIKNSLEAKNPPKLMVLMLQKEVAQRICARPPKMSILAVSVQVYAEPKIIQYVSKRAFWPQPKVNSAIVKIIPRSSALLSASIRFYFFKLVKAGFSSPRKQLVNNLSTKFKIPRQKVAKKLKKCGLDPRQRAQTLSVENWQALVSVFFDKNIV